MTCNLSFKPKLLFVVVTNISGIELYWFKLVWEIQCVRIVNSFCHPNTTNNVRKLSNQKEI